MRECECEVLHSCALVLGIVCVALTLDFSFSCLYLKQLAFKNTANPS